ncbi:MAG TPA: NifU family protein [Candidatus Aminicenantes bacterium]|nr:NifU family protein [Candidatus Aminicenantes bacterium]
MKERVENAIEKVRPALQRDGGDIEVVNILEDEKVVLVRFSGACGGCPMRNLTLKGFVEQAMVEDVPEITEVRLAD